MLIRRGALDIPMLSAVVLSGGLSTRMGEDKALVRFRGRTLVEHVIEAVRGVADEVIVSVGKGRGGQYGHVLPRGCKFVEDDISGIGPLEGLSRTFDAAVGEYVLVSPCDTPFLRTELCRYVATVAVGSEGAVPVVKGLTEPLHGVYERRPALRVFESVLSIGGRKMNDACAKLDLRRVDEGALRMIDPDLLSFWNLNTREDLARAEAIAEHTMPV
jgi:molybdopterin-guanine dinucleotide biosynthesis protein A